MSIKTYRSLCLGSQDRSKNTHFKKGYFVRAPQAAPSYLDLLKVLHTWFPFGARPHVAITEPHGLRQLGLPSPQDISVLSLDVFDTMLVRGSGSPTAHYVWLGRQLYESGHIRCAPETFARLRHVVELDTWRREGGMDSHITIEDFYSEVCRVLALAPEKARSLARQELLLEERILDATPQSYELLTIAQQRGWNVVFVSDTYLPAHFIEKQLRSHGLWPPGAKCFSSSDCRASKSRGTLYDIVVDHCAVPPERILHAGDSLAADVHNAQHRGIRSVWLSAGNRNRYETALLEARWSTGGLTAAFAGASHLARMSVPATDQRERALRDVTAGVAAPFLSAYLLWILTHAQKRGIERLYFLARDGEILYELTNVLFPKLGLNIDTRYLLVSRRSVNLSAVYSTTPDALDWAFNGMIGKPIWRPLEQLGLDPESTVSTLRNLGSDVLNPQSLLTENSAKTLRAAVQGGSLSKNVLDAARARRKHVLDYFRQEGVFEETPIGMVDLGGSGTQALALYEHIVNNGGARPAFYFLNIDEGLAQKSGRTTVDGRWLGVSECFLFNRQKKTGVSGFKNLVTAYQMFCAATHGTVLRYRDSNGRIDAVLDGSVNEPALNWGLPLVRQTAITFARKLLIDPQLVDLEAPTRAAVCANLELFLRSPSREEADAWGDFPFEPGDVDARDHDARILAPPLTKRQVIRFALSGRWPKPSWRRWDDASFIRSGLLLRTSLRLARKARKLLRR